MKEYKSSKAFIFFVLAILLLAPSAWPQASTATVSGTVRDQTGAVIPAAAVTLTNKGTSVISKTTTNEVGFYLSPGVLPGPYLLAIEASGMQKFEGNLTVSVQQSAVVDVVLKVGQTATEVSVQDVTPMLQVDNPTLGGTLERTRIEQLPINGRQVTTLLQTVPGMEGTRAFGIRDSSHELVLDGAALSDRYGNPNLAYVGIVYRQPGLDSIQEFKVENNVSSAKFTRPTTMVMTTKSGNNDLHGSAFETNRNNGVGLARSRTDYYVTPPPLTRNEFGVSAGGPVIIPKIYHGKNKTFWFFSYEALRNMQSSTLGFSVPTQAMRNGDMSGLTTSGNIPEAIYNPYTTDPQTWARQQFSYNGQLNVIDPALMSPLAKYLLGVTQLPTLPNVNPNIAYNWFGPVSQPVRSWTTSSRVDQRFSDKDQFYARYTQGNYTNLSQFYSQPTLDFNKVPSGTQTFLAPNKNVALSYLHTFSPTFFNELLVSAARQPFWNGTGNPGTNYDAQLGLPNPFNVGGWPGLYSAGFSCCGSGLEWETQNTNAFSALYGILDDNATKIKGKHEFLFGFHYRYDQMNMLPEQQQIAGNNNWATLATALYDPSTSANNPQALSYTGDNLANFYLGITNYSNQFVRGYFYLREKEYATYFQDNYRVTPRLTLNLGLRWEYWAPFSEKNNVLISFDPTNHAIVLGQNLNTLYTFGYTIPSIVNRFTSLGAKFETWDQAGMPQSLLASTHKDFGPRLGFAYRVGDGAKAFVVRGGYRTSYFHIPLAVFSARMRSNAPMNARFYTSITQAAYSPDGIANYGMRTMPAIIAGLNSGNAVSSNTAQSLAPGSASVSYFAPSQPDPRVQDWNFTVEKEVMSDTVLRVGYVGNHSSHLEQIYRYNSSTPAYIWYMTTGQPLPTGALANVGTNYFDRVVYGNIEQWQNTGWGNSNGIQLELERRYRKGYGYQVFYVMDNNLAAGGQGYSGTSVIPEVNQYLPGQVPADLQQRDRFLNYQRDTTVPKHRLRWNWIVDLPFGKGKPIGGNASRLLDRLIGGWQVAGLGSLASTYFSLPTSAAMFPTSVPVTIYGYKYPIQNCTSGTCYPGYLWWNGYIPAYLINSHDPVTGKPNGYEGIPANYHPAVQPIWPWPSNPLKTDPLYAYYGTNTLWVPLANGSVQRTTYSGAAPLLNQYLPSVRQWGMDASLMKNIAIYERFRVRLNADFFNVLNHPGNPNSVGSTGILSTQSSGNAPRTLQLSLRLSW